MNIRQKFVTLLLLIGVVPMLIASVIAYLSFNDSLLSKTADQLDSTATRQEQRINEFLRARQEEVIKLANRYDLQTLLQQYNENPSAQNKNSLLKVLQQTTVTLEDIQSVSLYNLEGKLIISSTDDLSTIQETLDVPVSSQTTTDVFRDEQSGFSKLVITAGVTVNKERTALLAMAFRTDDLIAVLQDYTGLDDTGETVVVSSNGVSLFPLRFNTDANLKTDLTELALDPSETDVVESIDYRGEPVLVEARNIGLTDWIVGVKIDRSEALASINSLRTNMIAIVSVAVVAIVVVALFFTRLFTRPIMQISHVAEHIGMGDFSARADIDRKDEIGVLATSVNAMGVNLSELVGNIETQRQRLQVVLDSITEAIFAIDENNNVVIANQASKQLLFEDPDTLVGRNMDDLFTWTHGLQPFTVEYAVQDTHTYSNLQFVDKQNNQRYAKVIVTRVRNVKTAGKAHAIVTIHDETSSRELENMKTDFVSMAAHELRTPLTAIRGYLEMVQYKQERKDFTDADSYVRQALKNVSDLGGLINNLLDVTRIERGTLTLSMDKVDLADSVNHAVKDLSFVAEDKHIALNYDGPKSDAFVIGDGIALREIVNNLLTNAIKYTKEGGKIDVRMTRKDNEYIVDVQDTGIGIPEKALSKLFTKFYRVHGGLDSGSTGTGLGLYIAKSIIDRHQGTISVVSKEGVGSTFTFTLPVFTEQRLKDMQPKTDDDDTITSTRRKRGWITKNIAR